MHRSGLLCDRHRVLVVSADAALTAAFDEHLAGPRSEVVVVATVDEALAQLASAPPCLAVVDTELPSGDPLALCSALSRDRRVDDLAVALVIDRGDEVMLQRAVEAGAVDIIHRPLMPATLRFRAWAQLRLHESRIEQHRLVERLGLISRAATDGIVLIGGDGRITFWNRAAEGMFGYTEAEALGRPVHDLVTPPHLQTEAARGLADFVVAGQGPVVGRTVILQARRKNGELFPVELSLSSTLVYGEWWALAIVRDITQRLAFEQRLRNSENQLRWILDSVPVGVVMSGGDRRVRWANQAALDMIEAEDAEEVVGLPCNAAFCGADGEPCLLHGETCAERSEAQLPRRSGAPLSVLRSLHKLELNGETVYLESFVDLTARRQLEAELGHARKLEAVGQLAAGIAHEINTPIQYVGDSLHFLREAFDALAKVLGVYRQSVAEAASDHGCADLQQAASAAEEEVDLEFLLSNAPASLDRCFDGIDRVATIVRAMKDFAHPDHRRKQPADLNKALENTLTIARNEYKYVAEVDCSFGDLPPVTCHLGDLNQAFLNLIVNAAHAVSDVVGASGKLGTIGVSTSRDGDWVTIAISDSGAGIPAAIAERVFEPFFTTKPVGKGSGQGLAIARSVVVEKHGGTLTFSSPPGGPTEFVIRLPIDGGQRDSGA